MSESWVNETSSLGFQRKAFSPVFLLHEKSLVTHLHVSLEDPDNSLLSKSPNLMYPDDSLQVVPIQAIAQPGYVFDGPSITRKKEI